MARYIEGEYERRHAKEELRLNGIHEKSVEAFGSNVGSAFFEYAYGSDIDSNRHFEDKKKCDWTGIQMQFARAIVETMEVGTTKEKVQAFAAVLEAFEVRIGIATRARSEVIC